MNILTVILTFFHLLPLPLTSKATPSPTPTPTTVTEKSSVTIGDEVYADLALQHELNHVSVYYFDGDPLHKVSINASESWDPASTIKLYAAMYAFDQVNHGGINLDQLITIEAKNVASSQSYPNGYGTLNKGDQVTVSRLIEQMITQSDNTAYNTLLDLLDRQQITKYIHDLGLINSSIGAKLNLDDNQQQYEFTALGYGPNLITAEDFGRAFILIKGGRLPGSSELFNILSRQKLNSMLPAHLPDNTTVAHKTGELDPYYHDGGIIVDPHKSYVLSVFSDMGSPNVVAHISDLIYTTDVNLVGNNQKISNKNKSEIPDAPIDPLVALGEPTGPVLALTSQNIKLPKVTASDLGIRASDVSGSLESKQLPPVIIPSDSVLHILVNLGEKIRANFNPIPQLRARFEIENLKLTLSEVNDLIGKGKKDEANKLLTDVDNSLAKIAKEQIISKNKDLQTGINQISETRFTILGSELKESEDRDIKTQIIKEIASQAINTSHDVKPYISEAIKATDLSQSPIVGKIVSSTQNSITVKTEDGTEITTPVGMEIKTRDVGTDTPQVQNATQIPVGSTIAVTPSFILTNIASDSAEAKPVTVLKVNQDTRTIVIASSNGVPQQIDLTSDTVIKGVDTNISLDQIQAGDVVVVHGQPIPAVTPAAVSPLPSSSTLPSPSGATPTGNEVPVSNSTTEPVVTTTPSITPLPSIAPSTVPTFTSKPTSPAPTKTSTPTNTPAPAGTPAPKVIKGDVIQVIQRNSAPTPTPKPVPPKVQQTPNPTPQTPVPTSTPSAKK
jgi:beta-lactamase class A